MVCRIQPEGNAACGIAHLVHKDMYVFGVEGAPGLYMVFEFFDCHTAISSSCTKIAVYDKKKRNNSTEDCACFTEKVPKKQRKVLKKNIRKNGAIELGKTATAILNAIIVQPMVTREMLAEQLKVSRTYPVIPYNKCLSTKKLSVYPNIMISTLISDAAADGTLPPDAACSWINRDRRNTAWRHHTLSD